MTVAFGGFNAKAVTFKTSGTVAKGAAVKITASGTVTACSDGDNFCGFAVDSASGHASVQLCGAITAPYSGTAPAVGYSKLASDGTGVKAATGGREYLIAEVNETAQTVTFFI